MPAVTILRLARVTRAAMVASGTRNSLAMSAVLTPSTRRRARALAAAGSRAGWVHISTSRRRSSSTRSPGSTSTGDPSFPSASTTSRGTLRCAMDSARSRSRTRRRAAVCSHATGLSGMPSRVQRRAAVSTASARASSTRSSRRNRARSRDVRRPHSSRTTVASASPAESDSGPAPRRPPGRHRLTGSRSPPRRPRSGSRWCTPGAGAGPPRWPRRGRAAPRRSSRRSARSAPRTARR